MVYIDPPYGIRYGSNFQPFVGNRDVTDGKDEDLTQEPETIRAFRDTWELGIHSYLTYLRDRLLLARELLTDSGSCFVQIGDENVHRVGTVMDEVFGAENRVATISYVEVKRQFPALRRRRGSSRRPAGRRDAAAVPRNHSQCARPLRPLSAFLKRSERPLCGRILPPSTRGRRQAPRLRYAIALPPRAAARAIRTNQ